MILGVIAALVLLVILVVVAIFNAQALIDVLLIVVAVTSFVAFALLGYAAMQVVALVKEVRGEVTVLVGTAQETLTEVQGTVRFMSESVVQPATRAMARASYALAWANATRATVKSFTEPLYKRRT
ncbi:MAG: hypothetical protein M3Z66_24105 [Chloroflexota bacterium]|nr:hypothetical protein [Chloroflexota bacterium]